MKKRSLTVALFLFFVLLMSCEKKGWFVKCQDCVPDEPADVLLHAKLDNPLTPIKVRVYEGILDDSVLYQSDEVTWTEYTVDVPVNKKYTITATYNIDGKKYVAVDSATPRVRYTEDKCDDPCYYVYDTNLNLRIKYTANGK